MRGGQGQDVWPATQKKLCATRQESGPFLLIFLLGRAYILFYSLIIMCGPAQVKD